MDRRKADALALPSRFLCPVLPSPRYVKADIITADPRGVPRIERPLFSFRCQQPLYVLERTEPATADYIRAGERDGVNRGYLASRRDPWYSLEAREPSMFLCTYMGRSSTGQAPFRVFLNESRAIATNVYLMLYPKEPLRRTLDDESARRGVLGCLKRIVASQWKGSGRVYGGGLHKVEPRELGYLSAGVLLEAHPELHAATSEQGKLEL